MELSGHDLCLSGNDLHHSMYCSHNIDFLDTHILLAQLLILNIATTQIFDGDTNFGSYTCRGADFLGFVLQ